MDLKTMIEFQLNKKLTMQDIDKILLILNDMFEDFELINFRDTFLYQLKKLEVKK